MVAAGPSVSAPAKGGVFAKGAKAMGVKSAAERAGNLKIRETASKGKFSVKQIMFIVAKMPCAVFKNVYGGGGGGGHVYLIP
jgi:hypothetical protein